MSITIYILKCADGSHYTGITKDLQRRLKEHKSGRSYSTRDKRPLELIHTETRPDYKTAAAQERKIKTMRAGRYLQSIRIAARFTHLPIKFCT